MNFYKCIFESLPFPCLLFEKKKDTFIIKEANSFYCMVTQRKPEELSEKMIEEVFPENPFSLGLAKIQESLKIAYTTQKNHKIDVLRYDLFDKQNGVYELKYWEVENIPIFEKGGKIRYILNVVKDITMEISERNRCNLLQVELDVKTDNHEQFIEGISDGLFSLDKDGSFLNINNSMVDIAEIPETDLIKINFLNFCGQANREKNLRMFNEAIKGNNQKFETRIISGKGRKKVLEITLLPLKNGDIITGLYGIAKDITKLKESEDALSKSERKFKALVQEGSDLIGILDLEGKYKFVSETSASVLGITPDELIGKTAFDYVHPDDQDRVIKGFSVLEEENQIQIEPFRFKNAKGEYRWIETKATNLINDPAIEGIVTNSRDVTDHINSQNVIKQSEERYRSSFENSTDAILVTIPNGKILAANPSACKMFQRTEKELCSLGQASFTDTLDPRLHLAHKMRKETGTATVELLLVRKDGTRFPGEITSSIFKDSEGNSRSSMIIRDITERKIAENKLLELNKNLNTYTQELIVANKGLEQFSYIISHNLRAPVANILGLTNLLNDRDYSEEIRTNLRKEIESNALRMDKVIKDLNLILRVKHDFSETKRSIDLNEIVQSIQISLEDLIKKENIRIVTNFEAVGKIKSISSFIHSIFYNLIFNSIKFRQPGEEALLHLSSEKENGTIRFVFKDNGMGIDLTKKKDEIFGLYKRFHHHVEGKGMGLFLVKTQTELLGGKISITSKVNYGTTFILEFKNQTFMQ